MAQLPHQPLTGNYNLCSRSRDEQEYAAAKTLAHFWLHQKRNGKMTRLDIQQRLKDMTQSQCELHRKALNDAIEQLKEGKTNAA